MSLNLTMDNSKGNSLIGIGSFYKFDGKDFPVWKTQMIAWLAMNGLTDFFLKPVTEIVASDLFASAEEKSSNDQAKVIAIEEAKAKAMRAYGAILFSLAREQTRLFLDIAPGDAYELWKALIEKYERNTVASKADTMNSLYECKMVKSETFC